MKFFIPLARSFTPSENYPNITNVILERTGTTHFALINMSMMNRIALRAVARPAALRQAPYVSRIRSACDLRLEETNFRCRLWSTKKLEIAVIAPQAGKKVFLVEL